MPAGHVVVGWGCKGASAMPDVCGWLLMGGTLITTSLTPVVVVAVGGGGHTVGLPGNEPHKGVGCLVVRPAGRLWGVLVVGGGIVGSLRTAQWTRASLIFVV